MPRNAAAEQEAANAMAHMSDAQTTMGEPPEPPPGQSPPPVQPAPGGEGGEAAVEEDAHTLSARSILPGSGFTAESVKRWEGGQDSKPLLRHLKAEVKRRPVSPEATCQL